MNLERTLFYTILIAVFANANAYADGIQSTQVMVINGQALKWPVKPGETPGALSSTNIIWDSDVKATNVVAGANTANFIFNFSNISGSNITVLSVRPSCGCTTAQLPPLPWKVAAAANGQIGVKVNLAGKSGTLFKTINVSTDKGSKILSVKITIPPPVGSNGSTMSKPMISDVERVQNLVIAQVDRKAVFHGDCASCHVKPGEGRLGKELYDADCAICHEGENRATMVPNLRTIPQTTSAEFWRTWIAYGRPHSLMPAFATSEGGPLSDAQIISLAEYIGAAIPSKSIGN